MSENRIKVTVLTVGPIFEKSGVIGPLTTPYLEDVGIVSRMVMGGKTVMHYAEGQEPKQLTVQDIRKLTIGNRVIPNNELQAADIKRIQAIADGKKADIEKREKQKADKEEAAAKAERAEAQVQLAQSQKEQQKKQQQQQQQKNNNNGKQASNEPKTDAVEGK